MPPRPPLTEMEDRRATVTDASQSTTFRLYSSAAAPVTGAAAPAGTPAASVPRHKVQARHARYSEIRNPEWAIFAEGNRIVKYCVVVLNYLFGVFKNSQLPFLVSFLV